MKKKNIFTLTFCLFLFASCSTIKKTATTVNVENNVVQYPTVVDLDVKEKIEATMSWNFMPFHLGEPKLDNVKGNLISETLVKYDADILLEPNFVFSKTKYEARTLIVTGYPAKYKNFRKATDNDLNAIKVCGSGNERTVHNGESNGLFGIFK